MGNFGTIATNYCRITLGRCDLEPTSPAWLQILLYWLFWAYRLCRYHCSFCKQDEATTFCWHSLAINYDHLEIMKNVITLLGFTNSLAMHTTVFCHCMHVCNKKLELYCKIHLFNLLFSHPCGNWLRFFQDDMFSLHKKKKSTLQNWNIFYDSSVWQTGFQWNPRRVSWQPTGHLCHLLVVSSFQAPLFYITLSVKLFQNWELEPRNG